MGVERFTREGQEKGLHLVLSDNTDAGRWASVVLAWGIGFRGRFAPSTLPSCVQEVLAAYAPLLLYCLPSTQYQSRAFQYQGRKGLATRPFSPVSRANHLAGLKRNW